MARKYETKPDENTHRFMDRNKPKGLRQNSTRDKRERYLNKHKSTVNRKRRKHGRSV